MKRARANDESELVKLEIEPTHAHRIEFKQVPDAFAAHVNNRNVDLPGARVHVRTGCARSKFVFVMESGGKRHYSLALGKTPLLVDKHESALIVEALKEAKSAFKQRERRTCDVLI